MACPLVQADDIAVRLGGLLTEQDSVLPAAHWVSGAAPALSPSAEPVLVEPGLPTLEPAPSALQQEAPPGTALTLEELEQIALGSNPTLVQARMAIRAAQGGYLQAGLYPNPGIAYAGGDIGLDGTSGQQGAVYSQEIVTSGKLRLGRAVASYEVQQARYGWEVQRWRVLNDVRAGYYEALVAQKMINVSKRLVDIGKEGVEYIDLLKEAGEVGQADVLQVYIEKDKAKLNLIEAENYHRAAWRRLGAVLGRPEMETVPLAGDLEATLPQFNWEEGLAELLASSPELGRARAGVQRARCEVARQCAERVPNVEVEFGAKYDESARYTLADVGLSLQLPIFNRNQGNITRAQADLIAAQREVERVELDLRDRFAAVFEQYANARQQVEIYNGTILRNAKESWRLIGIGKREGELGYLTLLTAQRTYLSTNLDYLAYLKELWARSVEIEGMLLSGGLGEVEVPEPAGE